MFRAFNVCIDEDSFRKLYNVSSYTALIASGRERKENLARSAETELKKFTQADGTIDGTGLSSAWFQTIKSDVFLSHSHKDEDLAFALAGWLKKEFNLNVFMDEAIWGSADTLLRSIDDKYCWQPTSRTYNYTRRNLTTSHVHAMLSTAIYTVMDMTEAVFFLNTEESVPNLHAVIEEDSKYTLSPWIYTELMATKLLHISQLEDYRRRTVLEHAEKRYDFQDLNVAYKIPVDELNKIDTVILSRWWNNFKLRRFSTSDQMAQASLRHPLDDLYKIVQ